MMCATASNAFCTTLNTTGSLLMLCHSIAVNMPEMLDYVTVQALFWPQLT